MRTAVFPHRDVIQRTLRCRGLGLGVAEFPPLGVNEEPSLVPAAADVAGLALELFQEPLDLWRWRELWRQCRSLENVLIQRH